MSKFLIIPRIKNIERSLEIAEKYDFGFEYNDFFIPDIMDDKQLTAELISRYRSHKLPECCTMHGAFFDVTIFSDDRLIREISEMRIKASLDIALEIGASAVVFHTNHNPSLTSKTYINNWIDKNEKYWHKMCSEYPDLKIYVENMFDTSPYMLKALAERMTDCGNFGVCLDYAHAVIYGKNITDWITELSPYVKHIHINDNDLINDLHLAVGDGKINWQLFKSFFTNELSSADTVLIETSSIENQIRSAEYLKKLDLI